MLFRYIFTIGRVLIFTDFSCCIGVKCTLQPINLIFTIIKAPLCLCQQTGVHHALNPDQYRGVFGSDGVKYARDVQEIIDYGTCGRVAGFIAEAIQVMMQINQYNRCNKHTYRHINMLKWDSKL